MTEKREYNKLQGYRWRAYFHNLGGEYEPEQWKETEEEANRRGEVSTLSGV